MRSDWLISYRRGMSWHLILTWFQKKHGSLAVGLIRDYDLPALPNPSSHWLGSLYTAGCKPSLPTCKAFWPASFHGGVVLMWRENPRGKTSRMERESTWNKIPHGERFHTEWDSTWKGILYGQGGCNSIWMQSILVDTVRLVDLDNLPVNRIRARQ